MEGNSFIFHLLFSCYLLSPSTAGLQLQRALGVSSTYKPGSSTVRLVWQLHPTNADIFYVKCNHSTSVNSSSEVLTYTWNNSRGQFRPTLEGWGTAEHNRTSFVITVKNPRENDVGWYRCIFNTQQSRDIQGTVQLDRMLDALQFVQGVHRNFTLYDDYASLIWTIHPPSSDIQEVTCLPDRGNMQRETFWCKQDAQRNWSSNSSRVTCILHDSYFELVVAEPSRNDQGAYNCYFISKTSTKNGIARLSIQPNSERGLKPGIIAGITIPSVICLLLLIMVVAVLVYYYRRRRRRRKQSITKQSSSQNTIRFKNRASTDETDQELLNPVEGQNLERQNNLEGELKQAKEYIAELEQKNVDYDNCRKISDQMKADLEKRYEEVIEKHTVEQNQQKNELENYRQQSEQMTAKADDIKEELEKRNTELTQTKAEVDRLHRVIEQLELENEQQRKKNKTNHQVNTAEVDQVDHGLVNRQQEQAEHISKLTKDLKEKENEYLAVQGKLEAQIMKNQTQSAQINQLQTELKFRKEVQRNFDEVQSELKEKKRKHKEKKQEVEKLRLKVTNMPNTVVLNVRKKIVETFQAKEQYGREEILNRISNILFECIEDATEKGKHCSVDENVERPVESAEALGVRPHTAASPAHGAGTYSGGGRENNYAQNTDSFSADSANSSHDSNEMIRLRLAQQKGKPTTLSLQAEPTSPNHTTCPTENTSPPADWTEQGRRPSRIQQSIGLPPEGTGGGEAHTEGGSRLNSPTDDRDDPLAEPAAIHQKENSNR